MEETRQPPAEPSGARPTDEPSVASPTEKPQETAAEVPQVPLAEVPQEPLVEVPQEPLAEVPQEPLAKVPQEPLAEVPQEPLAEAPVAPPRRSPSRRKRLLGKRVRKKTGGEIGEVVKKPDPTTSEDEADNTRVVERVEDRWKREDEEKRKMLEEKAEESRRKEDLDQQDVEQWAEIFKKAGVGAGAISPEKHSEKRSEKHSSTRRSKRKTGTDKKDKDDTKEKGKDQVQVLQATGDRSQAPWWKFWKRNVTNVQDESNVLEVTNVTNETNIQDNTDVIEETTTKERGEDLSKRENNHQLVKVEIKETGEKRSAGETKTSLKLFSRETRLQYAEFKLANRHEWDKIVRLGNRCLGEMLIVIMLCGAGAFVFRFTEGAFENFYKCGVKRVKRDFVEELWKSSTYLKEDEWKSRARRKLMDMEQQLGAAYEASVTSYSGHRAWSFINSLLYSLTVITTIGYGHIAPATTTGKALTIVYAIIGIPMFLILLADFGKLFTRAIKWVWAFVRRLYYTGSCKKVRKTGPVQEVMKGVQLVYDMAAFRRASSAPQPGEDGSAQQAQETVPSTPAPSAFVIDEEFNLPISLAIFMLVLYIFCGAVVFWIWEEWSFFDSFYFVFISMSTIGFGDLVPQNKMYMMASIVYLAFGLALTSMCINVVQEKLSDSFRQASTKIGATIGLKVKGASGEEVDLSPGSLSAAPVELALVHKTLTPTSPTNV